ncbi:uncharacterized protein LOC113563483 [Ooceraea biroi]|uniref:uncharacterized protein LOC113563483 n=1 Tax=Ooceraea biroi TaxID=2015173 RepID=UPI000F08B2E3|nr:uncharacterized protein LOC113563483 [Ooceraea biroi]
MEKSLGCRDSNPSKANRQDGGWTLGPSSEVTVTRLASRGDDTARNMVQDTITKQRTTIPGTEDDVIIIEAIESELRMDIDKAKGGSKKRKASTPKHEAKRKEEGDDLDMTGLLLEEDLGEEDREGDDESTRYRRKIQQRMHEMQNIVLDSEKKMGKKAYTRMLEAIDEVRVVVEKLALVSAVEGINRSRSGEILEEIREMRKDMEELRTKNTNLEREVAEITKKVTYLQQRRDEDHGPEKLTGTATTRKRPMNYLEAARNSIWRRPETESRKVNEMDERTGSGSGSGGGKDKAKDGNRRMDGDQEWTVVRRKGMRKLSEDGRSKGARAEERKRIPLMTEAVVISCEEKERGKELLGKAKKNISLEELGIVNSRMRRTATGATLIEILGEGRKEKADKLAGKLEDFFQGDPIKVTRPTRRIDLRISGLGEDTTEEEIREVVSKEGGGKIEEVRVGRIGWLRKGYGMVWVSCEAEVARSVMEKERICIGWTRARVERIEPRILRCYRCLEGGHTAATCDSTVDRSGTCHKCGEIGHRAKDCVKSEKCLACESLGLDTGHRIGSVNCNAYRERKRRQTDTRKRMESENTGGAG